MCQVKWSIFWLTEIHELIIKSYESSWVPSIIIVRQNWKACFECCMKCVLLYYLILWLYFYALIVGQAHHLDVNNSRNQLKGFDYIIKELLQTGVELINEFSTFKKSYSDLCLSSIGSIHKDTNSLKNNKNLKQVRLWDSWWTGSTKSERAVYCYSN